MVITAKFSSQCPKCSTSIEQGTRVNWQRGSKASHLVCPSDQAPVSLEGCSKFRRRLSNSREHYYEGVEGYYLDEVITMKDGHKFVVVEVVGDQWADEWGMYSVAYARRIPTADMQ